MPKNSFRGRGNPRRVVQSQGEEAPGNGKHFYNHDTRNSTGKFRGKPGRIEKHRRNVDPSRLKQMIEQDVDMGGVGGSSAVEPRIDTRRRGPYSRLERRGQPTRTVHLTTGEGEWRRIAINQGSRFEKEFILKTLMNACKVPFVPIYYHIEGKNAVFFVEDAAAAEALQSLSNQITLQEGFKLILHVRNGRPHNIPVGEQLREKMKLVMSRRYDAASKVLNLSKFYSDEEICIDYYAPLSRENVLHAVVKIISDNIPDVECIDLSGNKLHNLDALKNLKEKATGLKSLNLCNNKISQITSLDNIEGLPLRNLVLNQNPVCDRYTDQASYISAVRKRFPKLTHLDGVELGPVISFDIEADDVVIPPSRGGWYASPESQAIVFRFLEQYFMLYDSDDRQSLIDAYHDSAILSLTCSHSPGQQADRASRLDAYMKESRNLRRIESSSQRFYLLKKGKVDIVSFLSKLPKTTHDPRSLVVDVPVASSALIQVSMTGIFKERSERHPTLRWFQRVMVIIPNANGFCITNEQIHVTNATPDQAQNAFKDVPAAAPPAVPVPGVQPSLVETVQDSSIEAIRRQMVLSFSEQSGMNLEYSSRCLEDNDWDFNRAASVFGQLRTENKIPPEAFVRPLTTV